MTERKKSIRHRTTVVAALSGTGVDVVGEGYRDNVLIRTLVVRKERIT